MYLDIDNKKIVINSNDKQTYKLRFLNGLFNIGLYHKDNYNTELFEGIQVELYNNLYIKNNLYTSKLNNNTEQALKFLNNKQLFKINKLEDIEGLEDIEDIEGLEELQELQELNKLEELEGLEDIEGLEELNKLEELEGLEFKIIETYYLNIQVEYRPNDILYIIDLKNFNLEDMLHIFNMIEDNILYHYTNLYKFNDNSIYINLKFNSHKVIKFLDKWNYNFNEFKLLLFINLNKKEFNRLYEFLKYAILQLHKLNYNYKRLNKLFITLSQYKFKNNIYKLFEFIKGMHYFKYSAYHNKEYLNKLNRLILKDERFKLELDNKDPELGYINILFKEKPFYERLGYETIEDYKDDLDNKEYSKNGKRNNHGFDKVLGDIYSTELSYNDEFWKKPEFKNENRWTH